MATFTQEEIYQIKAAIMALATGARVVSVSYAGPPQRTVIYSEAQIGDLRALLAQAQSSAVGTTRFRRASFRKGFRDGGGESWRRRCGDEE